MIENPPLNEDLLIHFGIKGMHWGQRKERPDEAQRKKTFGPAAINQRAERARKIKKGAIVVAGALAVGLLMSRRGRDKMADITAHNYVQGRQARANAAANPFKGMARQFRDAKVSSIPSPNQMMAEARMAGVRTNVRKEANAKLFERSWRDSANFSRAARDLGPTSSKANIPSLEEIRARLADPNYVWKF